MERSVTIVFEKATFKVKSKAKPSATPSSNAPSQRARRPFGAFSPRTTRLLTYGLGFLAFYLFLTVGYGEVLERAEQESFVSSAPESMYYVLSQPLGTLWLWGRYGLLLFKWAVVGGAVLALVYTLTARLVDYALQLPRRLEGLGFLVPTGQIIWMVWKGTHLYFKEEPSRFVVMAVGFLLLFALLSLLTYAVKRLRRQASAAAPQSVRPYGLLLVLVLVAATAVVARTYNANEWLTARLQNLEQREEWETMIEEASKAERPTRAVNAYNAIALLRTGRLLGEMYNVPYDFPAVRLKDAGMEYDLFCCDCNYHAGLINSSYRSAMELIVVNGPNLRLYKRMALCALLNDEEVLCRKYLKVISGNPFERDFVERIEGYLKDKNSVESNPTFAALRKLSPREERCELNYRTPVFLGYNIGLGAGSSETLWTSIAACLYSKDLNAFLPRAQIIAQHGLAFPECMQQAIAIMALKQPELLASFPQVSSYVPGLINSFLLDAKPFVKDREALRRELKERWLGTYVYYYYTENNNPEQLLKPASGGENGNTGVN